MAPVERKNKETEGGDDLGTMDEVRVFKDEGDIDEEDAAESLHADLFEEEGSEGPKEGGAGVPLSSWIALVGHGPAPAKARSYCANDRTMTVMRTSEDNLVSW